MLIVIRTPRRKLFVLFLLSLIMVAASAWLAVRSPGWLLVPGVVGAIGILFFGLCGGWLLSRLFSPRVALILDRDGLLDNSSAFPAQKMPWDQITRLGIAEIEKQRFVGIDVRDRSAVPPSKSVFRRWLDDVNTGIAGYPVYIAASAIDRSVEELYDLIAKYWKDPKARTELGVFDPRGV